jgi:hypothetical protein
VLIEQLEESEEDASPTQGRDLRPGLKGCLRRAHRKVNLCRTGKTDLGRLLAGCGIKDRLAAAIGPRVVLTGNNVCDLVHDGISASLFWEEVSSMIVRMNPPRVISYFT